MAARSKVELSVLKLAKRRLPLAIGQVPLTIHSTEMSLLRTARRRYQPWRRGEGRGLPVFLNQENIAAPNSPEFCYGLGGASVFLESTAAHFRGVRHGYAFDSLLRVLLSVQLLRHRGFLLHAATVVRGERAYVFTGRSGAGKSTVAALSPPGSVLTDEISLLRRRPAGWKAYGTPFWGEYRAAGSDREAGLSGIYVLVQANEDRVERISARDGLRALLSTVLFFSSSRQKTEELLSLLVGFVESVPLYRLYFRRQASFWGAITQ